MRVRYQRGYLRLGHRKTGPDCWEFLWWDIELTGQRVRRKAVIGTVQQYPNIEEAWQASNGLRVSINEARNRQQEQLVTVSDLVDHYTRTELSDDPSDGGKSYATRTVYKNFLVRWVRPAWGSLNIRAVRTMAVEQWLRQLRRADGGPLAPSTKAKIRNVMSVSSIMLSAMSGWSRARTPSFLSAKVLSVKPSQCTWNLKNCERCFRNSITAFV